jgi:hypothetical protein
MFGPACYTVLAILAALLAIGTFLTNPALADASPLTWLLFAGLFLLSAEVASLKRRR